MTPLQRTLIEKTGYDNGFEHVLPSAGNAERLDAFNGFLLVANLDALFDRFLISFDDTGHLLTSARLSPSDLPALGIHPGMTLRWLTREHQPCKRFLLET